jgi:WD40 repeat protein
VYGVAYLPSGRALVALSFREKQSGELWRWDVARREAVKLPPTLGKIDGFPVLSPDGKALALPKRTSLELLDAQTGERLGRIEVTPKHLAFRPDGRALAGRCPEGVRVWGMPGGEELKRLAMGGTRLAFSPNGRRLASATAIHDVSTGRQLVALEGLGDIAFSPDGKWLASGVANGVRLAEATKGQLRQTLVPRGGGFCFSPNGQMLAWTTLDRRGLHVVRLPTGHVLLESKLPGPIQALAFAPDSRHLAVGNSNGTVYVLRLPAGGGQ